MVHAVSHNYLQLTVGTYLLLQYLQKGQCDTCRLFVHLRWGRSAGEGILWSLDYGKFHWRHLAREYQRVNFTKQAFSSIFLKAGTKLSKIESRIGTVQPRRIATASLFLFKMHIPVYNYFFVLLMTCKTAAVENAQLQKNCPPKLRRTNQLPLLPRTGF